MRLRVLSLSCLVLLVLLCQGCIGEVRETMTPRTSTEILLISTAAERAVDKYDVTETLRGQKVAIDASHFESIDKAYLVSALRNHLAENEATLVKADDANRIVEIRNGTLGMYNNDFVLGVPQLPISAQGFPPMLLPPLYLFRRDSAQGWCKLQLWIYDAKSKTYLATSEDLWGSSYYNQWWFFGVGPFDGSNDVYPDNVYETFEEDE